MTDIPDPFEVLRHLDPFEALRHLAAKLNVPLEKIVGNLQPSASPAAVDTPARARPRITDAAIRAAISDSYAAKEIASAEDERDLLEHSNVVMIGGSRRLRLSDAARAEILREAMGQAPFQTQLKEAIAHDKETAATLNEAEARSACLRRILDGETGNLAASPPTELRAAVAALERLRGVTLPQSVSLGDTQRLLERAELLEPLRIAIGATGDWNIPPNADRFVGRELELRTLRAFVDEIASESLLETVQRGMTFSNQTIRRSLGDDRAQGVRFISARGGLGKSALIAKFVLDHALRQQREFPFAYLDFDRAALHASDPRHLLLEVARQVALEFPHVAGALGDLRERIRQSTTALAASSTIDSDPFEEFRQLVRSQITHGERALLVVLDTIEIIQNETRAMTGVLGFLDRLSPGFTELRIVAAGRAEMPELVAATQTRQKGVTITLDPLTADEAREMVRRLGAALLPGQWQEAWTIRLAGKDVDPPERREPLSLRVAVEIVRDEPPGSRDARTVAIEQLGEDASDSFVGKLYESRVVGHVAGGEDVRRIAWPGLVVRRVTVPIIQDLLAPRLGVDPARAWTVFDALARQVWIVVRDGDTLRHQPDLRARTLPLMRRRPQFDKINRAAIEYFGAHREGSLSNRAEWIYHRLLGNESPSSVDADWSDSLLPQLKDAVDDFKRGSPAADYLAARTADRLLPDDVIERLDPRLALVHIARTGALKASMSERTLDPLLVRMTISPLPPPLGREPLTGVRTTLLVKTGRWKDVDENASGSGATWQQLAAFAIAFRRARLTRGHGDADHGKRIMTTYATSTGITQASVATLIQDLATSRLLRLQIAETLDRAVTTQLGRGVSLSDVTLAPATLRTAMLFGDRATVPATRAWVAQAVERTRTERQATISARELWALAGDEALKSTASSVLKDIGRTWDDFVSYGNARRRLEDKSVAPDRTLAELMYDALLRRCQSATPGDLHVLRLFAAARDEDWLVPLAYAACRATGGHVPKQMADVYETHEPVARGFLQRAWLDRTTVPTDVLEALRRADEASDVANAAQVFVQNSDSGDASDLTFLLECYASWRRGIDEALMPRMASA